MVLDKVDVAERMEFLLGQLDAELDILQVEKRIRGRVKRQMEKSQREYYLNEQVKAIHKELGEEDERAELDKLESDIKAAGMSKEAEDKALSELKKLKMMPADVGGIDSGAELYRHPVGIAVEEKDPRD